MIGPLHKTGAASGTTQAEQITRTNEVKSTPGIEALADHLPSGVHHAGPVELAKVKAALHGELVALEHEAKTLESEMRDIAKTIESERGEIARLSGIAQDLETARTKALGEMRSAKKDRRAEFDEAKAVIDRHFAALTEVSPDSAEALEAARKKILGKFARAAISEGNGSSGQSPSKWLAKELASLRELALPKGSGAQTKKSVVKTLAALEDFISAKHGEIALRQREVSSDRTAFRACDKKKAKITSRIGKKNDGIARTEKRLGEIKPRLGAVKSRIERLQAAINLIDTTVLLLKTQEKIADSRHERKLEEIDDQRKQERLRELERASSKLEQMLRQTRREEESAQFELSKNQRTSKRSGELMSGIAAARGRLERAGDDTAEMRDALLLLERFLALQVQEEAQESRRPR